MTLYELRSHMFHLYGRRNRIFLSGLRDRIDFLNLAIGDLQEAIRKSHGNETIGIALARVVSRIICISENFWELPLEEMMVRKYPAGCCSYCGKMPCACEERRPDSKLTQFTSNQLGWSLARWCRHLDTVYGDKNSGKSIEHLVNRLFKEIGELLSLQMTITSDARTISEIEEDFALELADALA